VGLPTVAGAGCAYSADIDSPSCGNPTTVHLLVASVAWGRVALDSCNLHAGLARLSGDVLAEHAARPECATTDCWDGAQ
jgi:hypothetical protein